MQGTGTGDDIRFADDAPLESSPFPAEPGPAAAAAGPQSYLEIARAATPEAVVLRTAAATAHIEWVRAHVLGDRLWAYEVMEEGLGIRYYHDELGIDVEVVYYGPSGGMSVAEAQRKALADEAARIQAELTQLRSDLVAAQADAKAKGDRVAQLEKDLAKAQADAKAAADRVAQLEKDLAAAQTDAKAKGDRVAQLEKDLAAAKADAKAKGDRVAQLEKDLAAAKADAQAKAKRVTELEKALETERATVRQLQADLQAARTPPPAASPAAPAPEETPRGES
jgi:hypothetical protein